MRMTVAAQIIPAELIEHDEQNVPGFAHSASLDHRGVTSGFAGESLHPAGMSIG
jgi:hypothetical protein